MGLDFVRILEKVKQGNLYLVPDFVVGKNIKDLMIRGNRFYAVWNDNVGLWETDETMVQALTDKMLLEAKEGINKYVTVDLMTNFSSNLWVQWQKYSKTLPDNYHELDSKIIFSNTDVKKEDYASKRLSYSIEKSKTPAYDKIMSTLYIPEERQKLEWAIGAIISGDSKKLQKFIVLYGGPGTGKSTVLNIIQQLFEGYYTMFDAKELSNTNASFALEQFKTNPLVAIQHDGDLSHIEDNTKLNSIISHEKMMVNEKHKNLYSMKFNSFLFMGTNKPVHISEAKSGLTRRLIDVRPSNRLLDPDEYISLMEKIPFELGGIAQHCLDVYNKMGYHYYDKYVPEQMMMATNDFYDFMEDQYDIFCRNNTTTLDGAFALYKTYNENAGVNYPYPKRRFREELKAYFEEYQERKYIDGNTIRHFYSGFKKERFGFIIDPKKPENKVETWIKFNADKSIFDSIGKDYPAQLANEAGTPLKKWSDCETTLKDINTEELHYVKVPTNHIVIDFDIKNEEGEKDYQLNLKAASKFPATYAELSKSGAGIHLHYIYNGDVKQLSRIYDNEIEVKVFVGNSSLRRKFSKCNDLMISTINSGLPLKEGKDMAVDKFVIKNEKALRTLIIKNLKKEYHASTKPSIDYIYKSLEDAYNSGISYDVTDMRMPILSFAMSSTHQSDYCVKLVNKMKFQSEETSNWSNEYDDQRLVFYDIEVFPNLFLVNWKYAGEDCSVVRMINPSPHDIEILCKNRLVGFNNRRYDNHIMYARMMGYSVEQLYKQSQKIINGEPGAMFGEAYNLSYTDVYDFAAKKQSLKKWEIELKIHHQELGLPWDQPVPEERWDEVAEYCDNDVLATEAVFNACQGDFLAREILAEIAGGSVNDTTNSLTTKLIFGKDKKPQSSFFYRDLSKPVYHLEPDMMEFLKAEFPEMMAERHKDGSLLPYFPGYKYEMGKSSYKDEPEVGEGGRVWARPGIYLNVWTFDVGSMHPHSVTSEYAFGPYTKVFNELMNARMYIKHKEFEKAGELFGGKLKPYLNDPSKAKSLANALKIAINSVYGLTAAKFENPFNNPLNKDNIVAKRGALFMMDLQEAVESKGGKVIHIKTDSIKIENPSEEIKELVMEFGKKYGYTFEVEHIFERICLINNAVYIGKLADNDPEEPGEWTATGAEFAHPYIFKTLFSKDPVVFEDMCETKAVSSSLYLDMNEKLEPDDHEYIFIGKVGSFCPIKPGCGGGELMREKDGKYSSATGTKGWRWLEAEAIEMLNKGDDIDMRYYRQLVDDAINDIREAAERPESTVKDAEWFINGDGTYIPEFMKIPDTAKEELPFD